MANITKINLNGTTYDITDAIVRSSVANTYSASATYAVGDYCIKDGIVYKCITAISTAEAWNATHWAEVKVMNEIESAQGGSAQADRLSNARLIDGVSFNGTANVSHYGTCGTAVGTQAKTVACTGFTLETGARIIVTFTNGNSHVSPTLNVNNTGAKVIQYRGAVASQNIKAKATVELVYDGTNYQIIGVHDGALDASISGLSANKTITALTETDGIISATATDIAITRSQVSDLSGLLIYYGQCTTEPGESKKAVTVSTGFTLASGACVRVKFTNGNASNFTLNVNGTGDIAVAWRGIDDRTSAPEYIIPVGAVYDFVYTGSKWEIVDNGINYTLISYASASETLNITHTA